MIYSSILYLLFSTDKKKDTKISSFLLQLYFSSNFTKSIFFKKNEQGLENQFLDKFDKFNLGCYYSMDLSQLLINLKIKVSTLSKDEATKYQRIFDYIKNEKINLESPKDMDSLIRNNPKWKSINTWETNMAKLTALINISDKELGKKYVDYRVSSLKPEVKEYSNNRVLKSPENLTGLNYQSDDIDFKRLILNLYIKYPPLRTDYSTVKLNNFNKTTDNYYEKGTIYFNKLIKNDVKDGVFIISLKKEETDIIERLNETY
ncbi:MAG: hypothetical protein AABY22_28430, partial [Nanoarchaeota archaeon]